jgi:phosphoribosylcarboxyaminoimidazole (NCAIR) mutase
VRTSVRVAWRVAAAVAFAGTAALAVILSRGAPLHVSLVSAHDARPAGRHAAKVPRCAPSRLDISIAGQARPIARVFASHQHVYLVTVPVEFTNISAAACTLSGYPQVSAYRAGGAQVGNAAVLDRSVTARRIVLAPGATAHAAVVENVSPGECRPVDVTGLRVVLPGQDVPRYVRHAMTACSAAGHKAPVFLHVRAVQAGAAATVSVRDHRGDLAGYFQVPCRPFS